MSESECVCVESSGNGRCSIASPNSGGSTSGEQAPCAQGGLSVSVGETDIDSGGNPQPNPANVARHQMRQAWVDDWDEGVVDGVSDETNETSTAAPSEAPSKLAPAAQGISVGEGQRGPHSHMVAPRSSDAPDAPQDRRWAAARNLHEQHGLGGRVDRGDAGGPSWQGEEQDVNEMDEDEDADTFDLDLASARDTARPSHSHSRPGGASESAAGGVGNGRVSAQSQGGGGTDVCNPDSEPLPAVSLATNAQRAVYNKDEISSESSDGG